MIRSSRTTFLSAAIFDLVKFHFRRFSEDLYGNPANFKGSVSATGWEFSKDFFRFVIRRSELTFTSAPIFDSVKFQFWRFLEDLYGNPANFKGSVSATGWEFSKDFFRFVIRRSELIFKSAPIFDSVKFHFWRFFEDLYGNPANFKDSVSATG